ncbi:hypothetical protein AA313_de0207005 [Arthrobotrys entomopaga]|nr:hypothetical protein AA313_de0207005 [Arthrobotrys entomopaga]
MSQVSCRIFNTTFNPTNERTGNKILRERLKGPTVLEYYPKQQFSMREFVKAFPDLSITDEKEEIRVQSVEEHKLRGKGKPKKYKLSRKGGTKSKKKRK